ncbi:MAG TPA: acetyl-CoA carboxylase, biotin carboxyl carrier protein, partial [Planctomycetes bacterium]|nr:acetyl-CoA carboxylase, biotin carboxyl carrier protein [Planctomycetota bacterium]
PMDGTFYRRPDPTARAFVSPGDEVEETTVMCLIETMKVFNEIKAKCTGTLLEALAKDGDPIELDQPLFRVKTNHD